MDINMFPLWAIILGGGSAALSRARISHGDTHFIALTFVIYYTDKAGEETGCVRSEDGCARFLLLTPQSALWKSLGSSQLYVYFANRAMVRVSQAGPPQGLMQRVSWGRRCVSALPPRPEKPFLEVPLRAEVSPVAQKGHFHFPEGYLHPAKRTYCNGPPLGSGAILTSQAALSSLVSIVSLLFLYTKIPLCF